MKKLVSMALVGAMAFSLLACGSNKAPDSSGSSTSGGATESSETASETSEAASVREGQTSEPITLTLWDIWPEGQPLNEPINTYIEQYQTEHPNITIDRVSTQEVDYQNTKLKVAAADGSQGDIFSCWGSGYAKTFVDAG